MENNMSKEELENIAQGIFDSSDIIALHGTTLDNAKSILDTGFNYTRTSFVVVTKKDVINLCTYGWKDIPRGDCASIVISVPKSFIKMLDSFSDEEYNELIERVKANKGQENIISIVTNFEAQYSDNPRVPPTYKAHIPESFIKGMFVYTDNKSYLDFMNNREEAMNHLTYIENPKYFENLSKEEQEQVVASVIGAPFKSSDKKR